MSTAEITIEDFQEVEMRIGTIVDARPNVKARQPAYVLTIDFGNEIGTRTSSAQLTKNYTPSELIGKQVSAVMNFPPRRIAGVKSEVLVLAGVCPLNGTGLLHPSSSVTNGTRIA